MPGPDVAPEGRVDDLADGRDETAVERADRKGNDVALGASLIAVALRTDR